MRMRKEEESMRGLGKCQIEGCGNGARWGIYKTFPDGSKKFLYVCDGHDKEIAQENLARVGSAAK